MLHPVVERVLRVGRIGQPMDHPPRKRPGAKEMNGLCIRENIKRYAARRLAVRLSEKPPIRDGIAHPIAVHTPYMLLITCLYQGIDHSGILCSGRIASPAY